MKNLKNKKILVTGGAGFIGSHMINKLLKQGAKVSTLVKYNSIIEVPRLNYNFDKIKIIECDLRNTDSVLQLNKLKYDLVFHFAAYNHVGDSFKHLRENIDSNLLSTVNLLNFGPKFKKFVHIGSSEIYGNQKLIPFSTKNTPNPMSPYAITKYASELYAKIKNKEKNFNLISIRPFNTFGPFQSEKAIIPEIIIKCLLNKTIDATQGLQTREFNYIENIIDGLLYINAKISNYPEPINLGSNEPISVKNLIKKIKLITNSKSKVNFGGLDYRPNEIWKMQADISYLKKIKYKKKLSFDLGLKKTIDWYKKFINVYKNKKGDLGKLSNYD